ncbi:hypothetical protein DT075_25420 [Bacillus licheniformis]|nr:hypothetical protein DT075_25420 [Bacillus licheniformis]
MLSLNAHHLLLDGIYYSYQYIPVDKVPLFSYRTIPAVHKIGFAFFLALVSFQAIEKPPHLDVDGIYMMLAMKEALIGLLLGLIAYMMISAGHSFRKSSPFWSDSSFSARGCCRRFCHSRLSCSLI